MRGSPPFGYKHEGGKLVPEPSEQEVIELLRGYRKQKPPLSFGNIAAEFNRKGIWNRGRSWNPTTLWYIAKRELG